jgi:hypothetical protein
MRGIKGIKGKEPIGAVLSQGIKGPRGNPIEKDRFHLLQPNPVQETRAGRKMLVRYHHPWFQSFNEAPPEMRRTVIGQIVHATEEECFTYRLQAYQVQGQPHHPRKMPFCVGDGETAERYRGLVNGEHKFEKIQCPHDKCEFRQRPRTSRGLGPPGCKPWGKLLFRIGWRGGNLPTMLCMWHTGGWNSVQSCVGFFEEIERQGRMVMGHGRPLNLGGFGFTLTAGEKTNPEEGTRFPVVTFAPLSDPIEFFMAQVDRGQKLESALGPRPALPAPPVTVLDRTEEENSMDYLSHTPGVE